MRDVRIQKVLAEQGVCSRRAAEQLIREGRVKLNGRAVPVGDKMDTLKDLLTVDGQKVYVPKKSEKYYYMMYKPRGYITTTNDERGRKTVMDLIADVPVRVYPVGRLDKDSEGLLLLTNDGDFANLLTHPSHDFFNGFVAHTVLLRFAVNNIACSGPRHSRQPSDFIQFHNCPLRKM